MTLSANNLVRCFNSASVIESSLNSPIRCTIEYNQSHRSKIKNLKSKIQSVGDARHQRNLFELAGGKHLCGTALHFHPTHGVQSPLFLLRHRLRLHRGDEEIN